MTPSTVFLWAGLALSLAAPVNVPAPRPVVVISDLHMGLGRNAAGEFHRTEDFRWPSALRGFLNAVSNEGGGKVDLVIDGDFLELWQRPAPCDGPPEGARTDGASRELANACTVTEMTEMAKLVVAAHQQELKALGEFAATGDNCLIVIPGNHDSTLVLDAVWQPVEQALAAPGGCVKRAKDGIWVSEGSLVLEHGHQIGSDANKYKDWPRITRKVGNEEYVIQPWGENFVQSLFNAEEGEYPLIDNLSPSSAGVRYRMAERGLAGSASDVAAFLSFNLLDTSIRQKVQILGGREGEKPKWALGEARQLGYKLFAGALDPGDPFAASLRSGSEGWAELRAQLDELAKTLPDDDVLALCDQLAIRKSAESCKPSTLGAGVSALLLSRERVMRLHLSERKKNGYPGMRAFVYGHTHSFEMPWDVRTDRVTVFKIANSGAFQRLIDDDRVQTLAAKEGLTPGQYLRLRSPESLPACYTSVHVAWKDGVPKLETRAWYMEENDPTGRFVDPCGPLCPNLGHGCGN